MTQKAQTGEYPAEYIYLEWEEPPDQGDEQTLATEAVSALFLLVASWLEPLVIEMRASRYDREIFSEHLVDVKLEKPFHHLVREPTPSGVRITHTYHQSVESRASSLTNDTVQAWVMRVLAQSCNHDARYVTSLRELDIRASRILLPSGWGNNDGLILESNGGWVRAPLELDSNTAWISAPQSEYLFDQPIVVRISNQDASLRIAIEIYWSPWVGEFDRPGSPLAEGFARLVARGWTLSSHKRRDAG